MMLELDIQLFGGRGASSGSKANSSRNMLQQRLNKMNANANTRVMMVNSEGGVVFNTRIGKINSPRFQDDLNREAEKVVYRSTANTIIITLKKEKRVKEGR